ncbi:MAG: pyridoxal-phosphate dependent enzyme, partial [Anaerolineae bacterium]
LSFFGQYLRWWLRSRCQPYFVYPGAPGTLGILGYVNAAFEIKAQLEAAGTPEPEAIFVAVGSCGTFAGLLLGARLAGLGSRIVGVRIIEEEVANRNKIVRMVNRAARYLHRRDPSVPRITIEAAEVDLLDGYLGEGYAHPTSEAQQAVRLVAEAEGLPLETTYTGKAMAALLDHAAQHPGSQLLFLDTFTESTLLDDGDYRALPEKFWAVFDPAHEVGCWCLRAWRDPAFCWKRSEE